MGFDDRARGAATSTSSMGRLSQYVYWEHMIPRSRRPTGASVLLIGKLPTKEGRTSPKPGLGLAGRGIVVDQDVCVVWLSRSSCDRFTRDPRQPVRKEELLGRHAAYEH